MKSLRAKNWNIAKAEVGLLYHSIVLVIFLRYPIDTILIRHRVAIGREKFHA